MAITTTTYTLRSKAPHQRKHRTFATYEVTVHESGLVTAYVDHFDYRSGKRTGGYMVPAESIGAAVVRFLAMANCSVAYSHYEDRA